MRMKVLLLLLLPVFFLGNAYSLSLPIVGAVTTEEELLDKVRILFDKEDYDEALFVMNEYLKKVNKVSDAFYLWRGRVLYNMGELGRSIADFEKALELNKRNMEAASKLADIYLNLNQPDKALKYISFLKGEERYFREGRAGFLKRNFKDALRFFNKIKPESNYYYQALYYKALILEAIGRLRISEVLYKKGIKSKEYGDLFRAGLDRVRRKKKLIDLTCMFGEEYDSNVGSAPDLRVFGIKKKGSYRTSVFSNLKLNYFGSAIDLFTAGYSIYKTWNYTMSKYNLFIHRIHMAGSVKRPSFNLNFFDASFNYVFLGDDSYLRSFSFNPSISLRRGFFTIQLPVFLEHRDYIGEKDRDSITMGSGIGIARTSEHHFLSLNANVKKENAREDFEDNVQYNVSFNQALKISPDIVGTLSFEYKKYDYLHRNPAVNIKRDDDFFSFAIGLNIRLSDTTSVTANYNYIINDSNINIYKYTKYIIRTGLIMKF